MEYDYYIRNIYTLEALKGMAKVVIQDIIKESEKI
jgi:hypothetical protein